MNTVDSILSATSSSGFAELDLFSVIFNFIMCVLMSFIARLFYIKYSTSLTGKHHIGTVIPILSTIVFLVILIVKSSLALSLGLVGALSIVRFRTPIKEPEELVYLFLSIANGVELTVFVVFRFFIGDMAGSVCFIAFLIIMFNLLRAKKYYPVHDD